MSGMEDDAMSDNSIPFGHGASAFGSEPEEEDMEFSFHRPVSLHQIAYESNRERYDVERAASPASSYESMESDRWSPDETEPADAKQTFTTKIQLHRSDSSASSCHSISSDDGISSETRHEEKPKKKTEQSTAPPPKPELFIDPNEKPHPALTVEFAFTVLQSCLQKLKEPELKFFKRTLWDRYPECFRESLENLDLIDLVDKMLELCGLKVSLQITVVVLNDMKLKKTAEWLQGLCKRNEVRYELKNTLRRKFEHTYEGMQLAEHQTLFESMYTDLHITDGSRAAVNSEHEFRQIQGLQEETFLVKQFPFKGIFDLETIKTRFLRTMIMKGSPGIGKSTRVQRFILDWVEGKTCPDVFFLLPFTFKELNQIYENLKSEEEEAKENKEDVKDAEPYEKAKTFWAGEKGLISPKDLICRLYPEMKEVDNLDFEDCKIMFIFDGFEDCTIPSDYRRIPHWSDHKNPAPLHIIITNLIKGNLLYHAQVWVTTQPIKYNNIPPDGVSQVLEVRGFTNEQREDYFRKTVTDTVLADKMLAHIKSCKTLYIMCHLPRFCWVVRKVLERDLQRVRPGMRLPVTLTHIYTNFLLVQINARGESLLNKEFIMKLGKLAFQLLEKDVFKIEKEHYEEHGLNPEMTVISAGLCTQFYRQHLLTFQEVVDSFLHATMQEYLAALYVFLCFKNLKKNILDVPKLKIFTSSKDPMLADLHKMAVEKALQVQDGKYNLFVRFLLGMSVETNQDLLSRLLSNTEPSLQAREQTAHYIRKKIKETKDKHGRIENLQRCLEELFPYP